MMALDRPTEALVRFAAAIAGGREPRVDGEHRVALVPQALQPVDESGPALGDEGHEFTHVVRVRVELVE